MAKLFMQYSFFILMINLIIGPTLMGCRDISKYPDSYIIEGRMFFRDVEGGCWQLIDGNNRSYEIVGEDIDHIHIEGLAVKLIVRDLDNNATTCMVGKVIELIEIIETSQTS